MHLEFGGYTLYTVGILAVHHVDEAICVIEVVTPQWPQLFLAPYIPHREEHILRAPKVGFSDAIRGAGNQGGDAMMPSLKCLLVQAGPWPDGRATF